MARFVLNILGWSLTIPGIFIMVAGAVAALNERDPDIRGLLLLIPMVPGFAFLVAGAPALAAARIIKLLEDIERNGRPTTAEPR